MLDRCSQAGVLHQLIASLAKLDGHTASEEVVLHLIKYTCMPILLYGFEVLNLKQISAELPRFCGKIYA